jgi:hypothetical protein
MESSLLRTLVRVSLGSLLSATTFAANLLLSSLERALKDDATTTKVEKSTFLIPAKLALSH